MNKIFAIFLLGFSGGALMRSFYDFGWSFGLFFVFLGLILTAVFYFSGFPKFFLLAAIFLISFGLGELRYEARDLRNSSLEKQADSMVSISGLIVDEPDEKESYTRLVLETDGGDKVLVTNRRYPIFRYGDKIEVSGLLKKPMRNYSADLFGASDFDWPAYLAKDDIYFEMIYPQAELISQGNGSWLKRRLFSVKEKFVANIANLVPEPNAGFLAGLTVGAKQAMPKDLLDDFRNVGVIHVVVLSGYNITIVADAIMRIFRKLPSFAGIVLGVLGIAFFTVMTGGSATAVRAAIMAGIALLARVTGRIYHITIALFAAGFLMILHNPKILRFDASFQLSFLATLALICLAPQIEKTISFIPKKIGLRSIVASTIATQLFVLPFLLYKMGNFSIVGLPANILILSFVPATMFFTFLTGIAGFISQAAALPISWIVYALSAYELWVVNLFSKLPFASFNLNISFWAMILVYAVYAILLVYFSQKKKKGGLHVNLHVNLPR